LLLFLCITIRAVCCFLKTLYHRMGKLCDGRILFYYKYLFDSGRIGTDMGGNHRYKQMPWDECQSEVWSRAVVGGWTVAAVHEESRHKLSHEGLNVVLACQALFRY